MIRACRQSGEIPRFGATQPSGVTPRFGATRFGRAIPRSGEIRLFGVTRLFGAIRLYGATLLSGVIPPFGVIPRSGVTLRLGVIQLFGAIRPSGATRPSGVMRQYQAPNWTAIRLRTWTEKDATQAACTGCQRRPFVFSQVINDAGSSEMIASTRASTSFAQSSGLFTVQGTT